MKKEFFVGFTRFFFIVLLGCVFISVNHSKAQNTEIRDGSNNYVGKVDPQNKILGFLMLK